MNELDVVGIRVEMPSNNPIVLLREREGDRYLPMWIGAAEASAIAFAQQGVVPPRPLTHDLLRDVVDRPRAHPRQVRITELRDNVFYAELVLDGGIEVGSRTSDAIALALRAGCPIVGAEDVLATRRRARPGRGRGRGREVPRVPRQDLPEDFGEEPAAPGGSGPSRSRRPRPRLAEPVTDEVDRGRGGAVAVDGHDLGLPSLTNVPGCNSRVSRRSGARRRDRRKVSRNVGTTTTRPPARRAPWSPPRPRRVCSSPTTCPTSTRTSATAGPTACKAAGITYRQLDYWARTGLVEPSVRSAPAAPARQRLYSFRDILVLKVVKRLLDTGVSLQQIRTAVEHLSERGVEDLAQITLMSDGASVYECTSADEVVDLVQGGQGVFGIAVGRVWREVEGTLAELPTRAATTAPSRAPTTSSRSVAPARATG